MTVDIKKKLKRGIAGAIASGIAKIKRATVYVHIEKSRYHHVSLPSGPYVRR